MPFESCNLISDFNGPNETPISEAGRWAKIDTNNPHNMIRTGNAAGSDDITTGESYYRLGLFGPNVEAYFTIGVMPGSGNTLDISIRIQQAGGLATYDGYRLRMIEQAGIDQLQLTRVTNAASTNIGTALNRDFVSGERIGIRCVSNVIEGWYYSGELWTLGTTAIDNTYPNAGNIGLHIRGTTGRVSDFYAGEPEFNTPKNISGRGVSW